MVRTILALTLILTLAGANAQRTNALKQMHKAWRYDKRIERMEKQDPASVTALNYMDYSDEVFPNERVLKFRNLESIQLTGRPVRINKRDSAKVAIALKVDLDKLKELPHLRYISLAQFDLSDFPEELYHIVALEGLSIIFCLVDSLPPGIHLLKSLKLLHLELNYLSVLPEDLGALDSLEDLNLANNHLRELPAGLSSLRSIRSIDLGNSNTGHEVSGTETEWESLGPPWPFPICANHISWEDNVPALKRLLENPILQRLKLSTRQCGDRERALQTIGSQALWDKIRWEKPQPCPDPWPDRWIDRPPMANMDLIDKGICKCSLLYY